MLGKQLVAKASIPKKRIEMCKLSEQSSLRNVGLSALNSSALLKPKTLWNPGF